MKKHGNLSKTPKHQAANNIFQPPSMTLVSTPMFYLPFSLISDTFPFSLTRTPVVPRITCYLSLSRLTTIPSKKI